jgi:hypothetical protein
MFSLWIKVTAICHRSFIYSLAQSVLLLVCSKRSQNSKGVVKKWTAALPFPSHSRKADGEHLNGKSAASHGVCQSQSDMTYDSPSPRIGKWQASWCSASSLVVTGIVGYCCKLRRKRFGKCVFKKTQTRYLVFYLFLPSFDTTAIFLLWTALLWHTQANPGLTRGS